MDTNISLSEEQRKRIEENKQKALAKRQERLGSTIILNVSSKPSASLSSSSTITSEKQLQNGSVSALCINKRTFSHVHTAEQYAGKALGFKTQESSQNSSKWYCKAREIEKSQPNNNSTPVDNIKFYGATKSSLKGYCVLISKDRFQVDIGFSAPAVEVFKSMKTRLYDSGTRTWHFNIKEHDALMKAVAVLQPEVEIEPLPNAILKVFRDCSAKRDIIPQADLTGVDCVLVDSLMPFQREGVNFGIFHNGRVLIADDMGLGKTLQAICLACYYRSKWPVLIVTPSSVRFDWAQQFKRWVPSLDPAQVKVAVTGQDDATGALVNIISYDLLSRKAQQLTAAKFKIIIMDESHFMKNTKTVRTKAALPLLQAADHVILLTGTPALSRPMELYTQIIAVCPRLFKFHDFGVRYCAAQQNPWGWDYSGSSNMGELQLLLEEKIMIRRLKQHVLEQLPQKRRQVLILDPTSITSSKTLTRASRIMEKNLSVTEKRATLMQYFRETCKVKLAAVRDYILDLLAGEKKFLIFAHHKEMLDSIEDAVNGEGVEYIRIDGKTSSEQRNFFCRKFQNREDCRVAVLSITAANAGINLSAASIVVFAELFWNPGILVQAEDRVHRLGQLDSVIVYYLVAQKTADDYIWPLVQSKLQVLEKAGLAKDDFAKTDTSHLKDPKQQRLLRLFEDSFIETTETLKAVTGAEQQAEGRSPTKFSGNIVKSSNSKTHPEISPKKRQIAINYFFQSDGLHSTSPQKSDEKRFSQDSLSSSNLDREKLISSAANNLWGEEKEMNDDLDLDSLAVDVDWDEDFDIEPSIKKIKA